MCKMIVRAAIVLAVCVGAARAQALVCYGDANCDGAINWRDIDYLIAGMNDNESGWAVKFPGGSPSCPFAWLDTSADGAVNWRDVGPFIEAMNKPCWEPPAPPSMELIPAGEFVMGDTFAEGEADELPCHAVYTNAFYMDTHEVTNQEYADALNWALAQGDQIEVNYYIVFKRHTSPNQDFAYFYVKAVYMESEITWNGSTFGVIPGAENRAVSFVTWRGAAAYANWRSTMLHLPRCYDLEAWTCNFGLGYRLPTEAEWEKAARGGTPGHRFPWSDTDTIELARANYWSQMDQPYDLGPAADNASSLWLGEQGAVGFYTGALQDQADWGWPGVPTSFQTIRDENGYGLHDLAANAGEWCNDWYGATYYAESPYGNPHGPASGTAHVVRGGTPYSHAFQCRNAFRHVPEVGGPESRMGIRCVRSAQ